MPQLLVHWKSPWLKSQPPLKFLSILQIKRRRKNPRMKKENQTRSFQKKEIKGYYFFHKEFVGFPFCVSHTIINKFFDWILNLPNKNKNPFIGPSLQMKSKMKELIEGNKPFINVWHSENSYLHNDPRTPFIEFIHHILIQSSTWVLHQHLLSRPQAAFDMEIRSNATFHCNNTELFFGIALKKKTQTTLYLHTNLWSLFSKGLKGNVCCRKNHNGTNGSRGQPQEFHNKNHDGLMGSAWNL